MIPLIMQSIVCLRWGEVPQIHPLFEFSNHFRSDSDIDIFIGLLQDQRLVSPKRRFDHKDFFQVHDHRELDYYSRRLNRNAKSLSRHINKKTFIGCFSFYQKRRKFEKVAKSLKTFVEIEPYLNHVHYINMAQKIQKTNVCRLLDAAGIAYELIEYDVDESDLSATHVAQQLGEDVDAVFKTIVLEGDKVKHFVCVVPGACEVDLKKAAKASGNKSCKPIPQKELLPLTGYIRGGCCPIGMKKPFPTYIDETCLLHEKIYVSAGQRGMQLHLTPQDLINYVPLEVSDLI